MTRKPQTTAANRRFSQKTADFLRKPQIFSDSPFLLEIPELGGAGNRRQPQIFAENRRLSQKTAGNRRLGSITFSSAPVNEGVGKELYTKGNSVKRFRPFSESSDSKNSNLLRSSPPQISAPMLRVLTIENVEKTFGSFLVWLFRAPRAHLPVFLRSTLSEELQSLPSPLDPTPSEPLPRTWFGPDFNLILTRFGPEIRLCRSKSGPNQVWGGRRGSGPEGWVRLGRLCSSSGKSILILRDHP